MIGQRCGSLVVREVRFVSNHTTYHCRCDCGGWASVQKWYWDRGKQTRCRRCHESHMAARRSRVENYR